MFIILLLAAVACSGPSPSPSTTASGGANGGGASTGFGGSDAGGATEQVPDAIILPFRVVALSADGTVVIGSDPQDPSRTMIWTSTGGLSFVQDLDASAISADGSTIVGMQSSSAGVPRITRVVAGIHNEIPPARVFDSQFQAISVSRDGSVVAGTGWNANPYFTTSQAFRWTSSGGTVGLGFLPGDGASELIAMSGDGATIVGISYDVSHRKARPFRWTSEAGMVELPTQPGSSLTVPVAVNDAGDTVGEAFEGGEVSFSSVTSASSRTAIVWTQGSPRPLGSCAPAMSASVAAAIATDGTALGICGAALLLAPLTGDPRLLSLPLPPVGFSESDQSVWPLGMSGDASVVVGRYELRLFSGSDRSIVVWMKNDSQPSIVAKRLTVNPGAVEILSPVAYALSDDGSTIVGLFGSMSWLLRLR